MEFRMIKSGKNKTQILHKGYRLQWNKGPTGSFATTYFRCVVPGCNAMLATTGEGDLALKYHREEQHTHLPDISANIVSASLYEFRDTVKKNPDCSAKTVFEDITTGALESVDTPKKLDLARKLPTYRSVKDQGYRQRKVKRPKHPQTLDEVDINAYPDVTVTKDKKDFYRGKTDEGAEVFMSDVQIDIATNCTSVFLDGTFSIAPKPFYQVVFIHGKVGNNKYPIATALLPNKLEKTYREVLEKIRDLCAEQGKPLDPTYFHSDCEMAIINAIRAVFPRATPRLCRFHITDGIRRNGNTGGLRPIINKNHSFKQFYKRVQQIFFFPIHLWPRIWHLILDDLDRETKEEPAVDKFLSYLVSQLIEYTLK